jgi:hypothetical protein
MADVIFKDDSSRLESEFYDCRFDPRLRAIVLEEGRCHKVWYGVPCVVTCVQRTAAENRADSGKPMSAHFTWRAVDLRVKHLPAGAPEKWAQRLRALYPVDMLEVTLHDVTPDGTGLHLHLNIQIGFARKYPNLL